MARKKDMNDSDIHLTVQGLAVLSLALSSSLSFALHLPICLIVSIFCIPSIYLLHSVYKIFYLVLLF